MLDFSTIIHNPEQTETVKQIGGSVSQNFQLESRKVCIYRIYFSKHLNVLKYFLIVAFTVLFYLINDCFISILIFMLVYVRYIDCFMECFFSLSYCALLRGLEP